jgi:hypothetical protein
VRRLEAESWEKANARSYFAARSRNGALDTVWQQAFRAERKVAEKGAAAAVLVDLKAFYDHIDYDTLRGRADEAGFPKKLTRLALRSYANRRRIVERGRTTSTFHTRRGIVAGCGLATTWVKVDCKKPLDDFKSRHPKVRLDTYIDDFTLSALDDSEDEVGNSLVVAALDLHDVIERELKCKVAMDKSRWWARRMVWPRRWRGGWAAWEWFPNRRQQIWE